MPDWTIRRAAEADIPELVALLADDHLGATRESPDDLTPYRRAFVEIDRDPNVYLAVMERGGRIIGTMQLTFLHGLSFRGGARLQIEAVRIASDLRGQSLGSQLIQWAIDEARRRGCILVQLTSNAARPDAHRFYERLGFHHTHAGFKLML
jgi:GNAT superfamily N-acetyltransferase